MAYDTALAGSAAALDTGTSGNTIPKNNTANVFSAVQQMNAGAAIGGGSGLLALRLGWNSTRIAAGEVAYLGASNSATPDLIITAYSGTEVARWGGAGGLLVGAATGGLGGPGVINAVTVKDDNVTLTCMALQEEFLERGEVDLDKWDAKIPDLEEPERRELVPVLEETEAETIELVEGEPVLVKAKVLRPKRQRRAVKDANGKAVYRTLDGKRQKLTVEIEETEERVTPARTVKRRHEVAHLFKRMVDDGFDPRDSQAYFRRLVADAALPGMPTRAEWQHGTLGVGEMINRLWLAQEMLAIVVMNHEGRIAALEASK